MTVLQFFYLNTFTTEGYKYFSQHLTEIHLLIDQTLIRKCFHAALIGFRSVCSCIDPILMSSQAEQTSSGRIDEDEQTAEEETVGCCRLFTRDSNQSNQHQDTRQVTKYCNTVTNIYIIFVLLSSNNFIIRNFVKNLIILF